ncbi:hypothetical protein INS49_010972 [Diaporthe citri]|uniref:uncharacterized protein n=1 Tax=Diaporthe citri TaxID=83186 RepID=UPI001C7FB2FF|nr:uncharacterized protein INS49_010972 [Diaporthe citri]KAG6359919.1 hypothetical protein INS49_010972 [Diaporthe citri]
MLLIMWLLAAFGAILGIATAEYDTSTCYTFAITASTTLTIPPVTIVKTTPITTVTLSDRDVASQLNSVNADPASTSSSVPDQSVTIDAYRIETLVQCGESISTLFGSISWTAVSETAMSSSIDSYIPASATPSLTVSTYQPMTPIPYPPSTEVSLTSYPESSIASAADSSTTESTLPSSFLKLYIGGPCSYLVCD